MTTPVSSTIPAAENRLETITVKGPRLPAFELVAAELTAGDIADSLADLVQVFQGLVAALGRKPASLADFQSLDPAQLRGLLLTDLRAAIFNVVARACDTRPEVIRALDLPSALAAFTATLNCNPDFFSTLPALLGLLKPQAGAVSTSESK